jgi:hypothetical protein
MCTQKVPEASPLGKDYFPPPGIALAVRIQAEESDMARGARLMTESVGSRTLESEELLLMAVLEQAIADLDDPCAAVRAEALAYVFSYDSDYSIFSFDSVCAYFKLSAAAVRRALRDRSKDPAPIAPAFETAA